MLPRVEYSIISIKVPSTKRTMRFRPFLVKEEKILLMARESNDGADMLRAIRQVVNNCALDDKFDVDALAIFDLEYLFLKLRAYSVDSVAPVSYRDAEDDVVYDFEINLLDVEVYFPDNIQPTFKLNDDVAITMKYPSAALYADDEFLKDEDLTFNLIVRCIDTIVHGDEVTSASEVNFAELASYVENNVSVSAFDGMRKFIQGIPRLKHVIKYVNKLGHERTVELSALSDFFTFY
jgi:hypothetical protein